LIKKPRISLSCTPDKINKYNFFTYFNKINTMNTDISIHA